MTDSFNHVTCPKCGYEENSISAQKCEICGQPLKKSKSLAPVIAGVGAAIFLAALGFTGYNAFFKKDAPAPQATAPAAPVDNSAATGADPTPAAPTSTSSQPANVANALSWGDRVLFTDAPNPDMQAGAAAYASGDYATAAARFETARNAVRNDPEALIYLNNAKLGSTPVLGIAVVVPIGDSPNTARELLRGVAQAQDEVIKAGTPFKVLIANDRNDAGQAEAIANALVQDPNVVGVIGHGTSTTTLAAAPIYQQGQLPMIAPTSTTTELATLARNGSNFVFRVIPSDQFTGTTLARHMLSLGKNRPIVFYNSQSSYSKSLQEAFSTTLGLEGGQVAKLVDLSQGNPTAELQGSGADAIVLLPDSATFDAAIAVAQLNQGQLPMLAGDAFYRIEALQKGGASLTGTVVTVPWHPLKSTPPFAQTSSGLWGGDVNWRTALSYDAFQALSSARTVGNVTPAQGQQGRAAIGQALAAQGFSANGSTGAISFLPSGDRNTTVLLVEVRPGTRSGTGFDFVPLP
ncbi:ABC transporter substrate-binding protein [Nodosilinea sp. LEGE 06152]|uniref:ABC transporter substrate-binding protein n=1 Tax=Nodosilinea sp. LEGE 06152 TaxID=2777966 RepID=UPI00187DE823|nr:ABC transporter substrate-binding protein [Nodosilinea sp. LEGE 06152]MBE9159428.1 ABC transporter substrate-binding protein [Nodosilinea sp. LEGE 06152]